MDYVCVVFYLKVYLNKILSNKCKIYKMNRSMC